MLIGMLVGLIQFRIWGIPISIGSGGGCLLSGLFFGWLHSIHPNFSALPLGASSFLRDFGLAVFVGIVGIAAGPQAMVAIHKFGPTLLLLGVGVTLISQIVTFFFSYYVLRIRNPIEALACVAGGRPQTHPLPRCSKRPETLRQLSLSLSLTPWPMFFLPFGDRSLSASSRKTPLRNYQESVAVLEEGYSWPSQLDATATA